MCRLIQVVQILIFYIICTPNNIVVFFRSIFDSSISVYIWVIITFICSMDVFTVSNKYRWRSLFNVPDWLFRVFIFGVGRWLSYWNLLIFLTSNQLLHILVLIARRQSVYWLLRNELLFCHQSYVNVLLSFILQKFQMFSEILLLGSHFKL